MAKEKDISLISEDSIKNKIYTIRGFQVMLDSDLAEIYGYSTKDFNRQVRNNIERFDDDFMFQITKEEVLELSRCKYSTSIMQTIGIKGGRVYLPYVFTESGIYMLMTVLKSELAIKQSKMLIRLFRSMKDFVIQTEGIYRHLEKIDGKLLSYDVKLTEHDKKFEKILEDLTDPNIKKSALFFAGQMFDAFSLLTKLITEAKDSIILIDNYIDTATLDILAKKKEGVKIKIITSAKGNKLTTQDLKTFTSQYGELEIKLSDEFHDRFLILDELKLYHIGASLKDAGKKCFEISLIDDKKHIEELLKRIKEETC